ncbi:hypothetical protein J2S40_003984 [Nocardioides luteus]|uniref:Uncharacterized protein n=1 Tax=Nocardioides luteus TaxID=1844 RepID=A0ABQ5SR86_9ACTN|nr:hypothetical protein [Nocardioides luteus]MDR7312926.1 hypothetical protein [Nocardioides luteus]GGR45311.1 hypothetical protein GCM10010197_08730 [Nocardioides luteus]GLJ65987.1 hypothetical protein GCM10017579_00230 [Nocardioides luteus]
MSTLPGTWDLDLRTPIGTLHVRYVFTETPGGITGTATSDKEAVPVTDIAVGQSDQVTWKQRVTKPMRLNLDFDVIVDGDTMTGHSRAGRLPGTTVSGKRVAR